MLALKSTPEERAVVAALAGFSDEELVIFQLIETGTACESKLRALYAAEVARRKSITETCRWCERPFLRRTPWERYCQVSCREKGFERAKRAAPSRRKKKGR